MLRVILWILLAIVAGIADVVVRSGDAREVMIGWSARRHPRPVIAAPPPEPSITIDEVLELRYLLLAHQFDRLDERLVWSVDSARRDSGYELRYRTAIGAFLTADPDVRPHLQAWVAAKPLSAPSRLARAAQSIAMAGAARGEKWVSETPRRQLQLMRAWHDSARPDLKRAMELDSTNVIAHWLTMQVAMYGSSRSVRRAVLDDGLRQVPGSLLLRWRYAFTLRPRWGGSTNALYAFADESEAAAALNPRLHVIAGMVAYDSAVVLSGADRDEEAVAMFTRALSHGDFFLYREARGVEYRYLKRYPEAIADFDTVLAQLPTLEEARPKRAAALYWLSRRSEGAERDSLLHLAKRDICIAAELDRTNSYLLNEIDRIPELRPPSMGGATPLSPIAAPDQALLAHRC